MQVLLKEETTKNINKKNNKQITQSSNLFGLGLVSLVAACGGEDKAAANIDAPDEELPNEELPNEELPNEELPNEELPEEEPPEEEEESSVVPPEEEEEESSVVPPEEEEEGGEEGGGEEEPPVEEPPVDNGIPTTAYISALNKAVVTVRWSKNNHETDLLFANTEDSTGIAHRNANLYHFGTSDTTDLIISIADLSGPRGGIDSKIGAYFIYWNIQDTSTTDSLHLSIFGARANDQLSYNHRSEPILVKLGTVVGEDPDRNQDGVDMIIRTGKADKYIGTQSPIADVGAIYIIWDIDQYRLKKQSDQEIFLDNFQNFAVLELMGSKANDQIGHNNDDDAIQFATINRDDNKYDLIIKEKADKDVNGGKGAIYIIWNVNDYDTDSLSYTFKNYGEDPSSTSLPSGVLTIIGRNPTIDPDSGLLKYHPFELVTDTGNGPKFKDFNRRGEYDLMIVDDEYTYILFGESLITQRDSRGEQYSPILSRIIDLNQVDFHGSEGDPYRLLNYDSNNNGARDDEGENFVGFRTTNYNNVEGQDGYADLDTFYDGHFVQKGSSSGGDQITHLKWAALQARNPNYFDSKPASLDDKNPNFLEPALTRLSLSSDIIEPLAVESDLADNEYWDIA